MRPLLEMAEHKPAEDKQSRYTQNPGDYVFHGGGLCAKLAHSLESNCVATFGEEDVLRRLRFPSTVRKGRAAI
jgi:hypothetical protein